MNNIKSDISVYNKLKMELAKIHAEMPAKRDVLEEIRPMFIAPKMDNFVFGQDDTDKYPIELRPSHRAKWTKTQTKVSTGNDDRHIDAGWNYVSVTPNLVKPVLRRHVHSIENPEYASLDELLEERSAREEEPDDLDKDWKTFGIPIPWKSDKETIDDLLEERSAREEEPDNWEKNQETFGNTTSWEHEPFDSIL